MILGVAVERKAGSRGMGRDGPGSESMCLCNESQQRKAVNWANQASVV